MSGHSQHDDHAHDHAGHDDHHEEASSDDFPADEPRSPGWLPLVGGALLLAGICGYMALGSDDKSGDAAVKPEPVAAAAPAAPPQPAQPPPGLAKRPAPIALPPGAVMPPNHPRPAAQ